MPAAFDHSTWLQRVRQTHGCRYNYSKVIWTSYSDPVEILCKVHGSFWQRPKYHANGSGCKECALRETHYTTEQWVSRAKAVHGDRYDYSKSVYAGTLKPIKVLCRDHGAFTVRACNHIARRSGCPKCKADAASIRGALARSPNIKTRREVTVRGKTFIVDSSAEQTVLEWLVNTKKVSPKEILDQRKTPTILFKYRCRVRAHKPDFIVKGTLVEVKSQFTLGVGDVGFHSSRTKVLGAVKRKARAAEDQGYTYKVVVANRKGNTFVLPRNWDTLPLRTLQKIVREGLSC